MRCRQSVHRRRYAVTPKSLFFVVQFVVLPSVISLKVIQNRVRGRPWYYPMARELTAVPFVIIGVLGAVGACLWALQLLH